MDIASQVTKIDIDIVSQDGTLNAGGCVRFRNASYARRSAERGGRLTMQL